MQVAHERFPVTLHYAAPARYAKGGLVDAALAVKKAGRYGDTEIIHVNKAELAELKHMWGEPTINPQTGQPEFFLGFLKKLLPIALSFIPGVGPFLGAAAGAAMGATGGGGWKGALAGGLSGAAGIPGVGPAASLAMQTGAGALTGGVGGAALGALGGVGGAGTVLGVKSPFLKSTLDTITGGAGQLAGTPSPDRLAAIGGAPAPGIVAGGASNPNFWNRNFLGINGVKNKFAVPALVAATALLGKSGGNSADGPPDQAAQDKFFNPVFRSTGHQPTSGFSDLGARGQGDGSISNSRAFQAYNAGYMPERANFNYVQGGYAKGGTVSEDGGSPFAVKGPGTGRSDSIPAKLSDGEYVMDAETVNMLGDGSTTAGARKLDALRVNLRKHKGRNLARGKISLSAKRPEAYMAGGRA